MKKIFAIILVLVYPSLLQLKDKRVIFYKREFIKRIFNILNGTQSGI